MTLGDAQRNWVIATGDRYWPENGDLITSLVPAEHATLSEGVKFCVVPLPTWAHDLAVDGGLLVDASCLNDGDGEPWRRCDWIKAAWLHISGSAEQAHEAAHGPVHSYAFRIRTADPRLFDRAWVNRIFLFLRRCAAREKSTAEEELFGPLPTAEIVLTHDIDALWKTVELRLKQGVFYGWNALRSVAAGDLRRSSQALRRGARFALRSASFDTFAQIRALEDEAGIRSVWHFYGGAPGWRRGTPVRILLDPAYDIRAPSLRAELATLIEGGWTVGLHQSFEAWRDAGAMREERLRIEDAAKAPVTACRQHWLRFSWGETWRAQEEAGLKHDSTLGFNDRPGFRNGAALRFHPWDHTRKKPLALDAIPMILMDSHFYDYQIMTADDRAQAMSDLLEEVRAVHGQATVNWHTHTITDAYGWGDGFKQLVSLLR